MAMNSLPQGDLLLATSNGFAGAMVPSRSELFDMAISVAFGGSLRTAIILNSGHVADEGQGRMLELLSNPAVMVELIKNANREQTLALADAYEKGDVNTIGKIRGEILAMMPLPGPVVVGNVSKVSKLTKLEQLAGKAADLQKVEKAADAAQAAKVASAAKGAGSSIDDLLAAAKQPFNSASEQTVLARAWDKHAGRLGRTFTPLSGNTAAKNAAAEQYLRDLLSNPSTVRTELSRGGFEYRLPSGQGVRFNADGSFNTLLDPKRL